MYWRPELHHHTGQNQAEAAARGGIQTLFHCLSPTTGECKQMERFWKQELIVKEER